MDASDRQTKLEAALNRERRLLADMGGAQSSCSCSGRRTSRKGKKNRQRRVTTRRFKTTHMRAGSGHFATTRRRVRTDRWVTTRRWTSASRWVTVRRRVSSAKHVFTSSSSRKTSRKFRQKTSRRVRAGAGQVINTRTSRRRCRRTSRRRCRHTSTNVRAFVITGSLVIGRRTSTQRFASSRRVKSHKCSCKHSKQQHRCHCRRSGCNVCSSIQKCCPSSFCTNTRCRQPCRKCTTNNTPICTSGRKQGKRRARKSGCKCKRRCQCHRNTKHCCGGIGQNWHWIP